MKNIWKSKLFIGAMLGLAAVAAVVAVMINTGRSGGNDLQRQLDLGKRYVSELDYENAVIAFEAALEIDPYCLDAYMGLADAYMALGQPDKSMEIMEQARGMLPESVDVYVRLAQLYAQREQMNLAISTLEEGIRVTDSDRLREMLGEYQPEQTEVEMAENSPEAEEEEGNTQLPPEEGEETSLEIGFEQDMEQEDGTPALIIARNGREPVAIPVVAPGNPVNNATNDERGNGNGTDSEEGNSNSGVDDGEEDSGSDNEEEDSGQDDGEDSSDNENNDGTSEDDSDSSTEEPDNYRTGLMGLVSGVDGQRLEGVTISIYAGQEEVPITTSTDAEGYYRQGLDLPGSYRIVLSKEGYVDLSTSVVAWDNAFQNMSYLMLTTEESQQLASMSGIVLNAVDGRYVEGATVSLLDGYDNVSGDSSDAEDGRHTFTGNDGSFSMEDGIHAGYYTVEVSKDNYSTYHRNETIKPGENEFNIAISPSIQVWNEYRIVLTWGERPRDLDSHLICNGNDNFHVYFGNKDSNDGNASLDIDDVTSYGPETTTVKVQAGNSYIYAVHNYSDKGASEAQEESWNLAHSQARVVVYDGEGVIFDGSVPTDKKGVTWEVFRIENGQLVVTNQVSFQNPYMLEYENNGEPMALAELGNETAGREYTGRRSAETEMEAMAENTGADGILGGAGSDAMTGRPVDATQGATSEKPSAGTESTGNEAELPAAGNGEAGNTGGAPDGSIGVSGNVVTAVGNGMAAGTQGNP